MNTNEVSHLEVFVDGGCLGNGNETAACYGSYKIFAILTKGGKVQVRHETLTFPEISTNNQAEYKALIAALTYLKGVFEKMGQKKGQDVVLDARIFIDSDLIIHQVNGSWKCKDAELRPLRAEAAALMDEVRADLSWIHNSVMKEILGH